MSVAYIVLFVKQHTYIRSDLSVALFLLVKKEGGRGGHPFGLDKLRI